MLHGEGQMVHIGAKYSTDNVKYSTEVLNIPRRVKWSTEVLNIQRTMSNDARRC